MVADTLRNRMPDAVHGGGRGRGKATVDRWTRRHGNGVKEVTVQGKLKQDGFRLGGRQLQAPPQQEAKVDM
eukprot:433569-Pyramimonas_sp.AAC.1